MTAKTIQTDNERLVPQHVLAFYLALTALTQKRPRDLEAFLRKALRIPKPRPGHLRKCSIPPGVVKLFRTIVFQKFRMEGGRLAARADRFTSDLFYLTSLKELCPGVCQRTASSWLAQLKDAQLVETRHFRDEKGEWASWGVRPNVERILEVLEIKGEVVTLAIDEFDSAQIVSIIPETVHEVVEKPGQNEAVLAEEISASPLAVECNFFSSYAPGVEEEVATPENPPVVTTASPPSPPKKKRIPFQGPAAPGNENFLLKNDSPTSAQVASVGPEAPGGPNLPLFRGLDFDIDRDGSAGSPGQQAGAVPAPDLKILEFERELILNDKWVRPVLDQLNTLFSDVDDWMNEPFDPEVPARAEEICKHLRRVARLVRNDHEVYGLTEEKAKYIVENGPDEMPSNWSNVSSFETILRYWIPYARRVWDMMTARQQRLVENRAYEAGFTDEGVPGDTCIHTGDERPALYGRQALRRFIDGLRHLPDAAELLNASTVAVMDYIRSRPIIYSNLVYFFPSAREVLKVSDKLHHKLLTEARIQIHEFMFWPRLREFHGLINE